jgi:hypothetical protein
MSDANVIVAKRWLDSYGCIDVNNAPPAVHTSVASVRVDGITIRNAYAVGRGYVCYCDDPPRVDDNGEVVRHVRRGEIEIEWVDGTSGLLEGVA